MSGLETALNYFRGFLEKDQLGEQANPSSWMDRMKARYAGQQEIFASVMAEVFIDFVLRLPLQQRKVFTVVLSHYHAGVSTAKICAEAFMNRKAVTAQLRQLERGGAIQKLSSPDQPPTYAVTPELEEFMRVYAIRSDMKWRKWLGDQNGQHNRATVIDDFISWREKNFTAS